MIQSQNSSNISALKDHLPDLARAAADDGRRKALLSGEVDP